MLVGAASGVAGVVFVVLGRLGARRLLPRNWLVGIRTRSTLRNDEAWFIAHEVASPSILRAGYAGLVTAAIAVLVPFERVAVGLGLVGIAGVVTLLIRSSLRGDRAARAAGYP